MPIFKEGCRGTLSVDNFTLEELSINVYPNPTVDIINIRFFGTNDNVKIILYNAIGAVVKEITNRKYNSTEHILNIDLQRLPRGNYFLHYQSKGVSKTKKILKY